MSYIGRCQLSGYKSIKNVSCEFNKGLNIIIGNNGSGKTNLLEFIYKILKKDYAGLDIFNAEISISEDSTYGRSTIHAKSKPNESYGLDVEPSVSVVSEPNNEVNYTSEFVRFNLDKELPIISNEYNPKYDFINKRFLINDIIVPQPYNLRSWLFVLFKKAKLEIISQISDLTEDYLLNSLNGFFQEFFTNLKSELISYTPIEDIRFSNAIRVTNIDASTLEFRNIVFEYKLNNQWFSWNALSDGTKRLVFMIISICGLDSHMLHESVKGIIGTRPISFVEEPEIGIHPHQLHLILTFLKERAEKQQIIITTHSPQVLDVLSEDELDRIFITDIDFEKGTTIRKLTEKETAKAKFYLHDEAMLSDYWRFSDLQRSKDSE